MQRRLLTCLCALALAAPAQAAQDPRVDPDSPAGSEYQLPVDRAREQARERGEPAAGSRGGATAAGGSQNDGSSGKAPLFGSGVQSRTPKQKAPRAAGAKTDGELGAPRTLRPGLGTGTPEIRAQSPSPDDGGAHMLTIGAVTAGVLLIGVLAGLLWRRRAGP